MSATTTTYAGLDLSGTTRPPMTRLVKVELRKMVDTRAGMWLMIAMGAITVVAVVIFGFAANQKDLTFGNFMGFTGTPQGFLLPVMGILLVTQEWSQRTAMVTFTLEPSRSRFLAAKYVGTLIIALTAVVIGLALTISANALYGALSDHEAVWGVSAFQILCYFLLYLFAMSTGFAFGMLLLNTAAAIVIYFVYSFILPGLFELGTLMDWFKDIRPWIDFNLAQTPLTVADVTGKEWAQLATSGLVWLVLPMMIGIWRVLRAEVK